jgi:hypothetical protein
MNRPAGRALWPGNTSPRWTKQHGEGYDHTALQKPGLLVWIEIASVLLMKSDFKEILSYECGMHMRRSDYPFDANLYLVFSHWKMLCLKSLT